MIPPCDDEHDLTERFRSAAFYSVSPEERNGNAITSL